MRDSIQDQLTFKFTELMPKEADTCRTDIANLTREIQGDLFSMQELIEDVRQQKQEASQHVEDSVRHLSAENTDSSNCDSDVSNSKRSHR